MSMTATETRVDLAPLPAIEVEVIHLCDESGGPPYCGAEDCDSDGWWDGTAERMCPQCLVVARYLEREEVRP